MALSKKAAEEFVERWKVKEGSEDREARSFWIELCGEVLGIANPTHVLDFERKVQGRRIDVFFEDMGVLIEHKSRSVSLDEPEQRGWINKAQGIPRMVTPFEQAKWYADNITPRSIAPKWVITCNFDELRIYDLDVEYAAENYETITLDELPRLTHRLSFITRKENSRLEREKQLSIRAGEVVGRLYDAFSTRYHDIENDEEEQRSLNILITRIVFLLYAEDAELLQERNAFYNYLKNFQVQHMRQALIDLFQVLKTPEEERDPYLSPEVSAFPYVNGGLFEADIIIPQFDIKTHNILLNEASAEFDWSDISPTIFGAVFESTLNPETRRAGGMHYTSVENIHKVTGPLFYDTLKDELTAIEGLKSKTERDFKLRAFRSKIASLKILDPCMGSGHILCVLFDVLVRIYEDYGYTAREAAVKIVENNLWGLDIDERAAQLSYFAVMMKARQYDRRFFTRKVQPHVYAIEESNGITSAPMHDMGLNLSQEEYGKAVKQIMRLVEEMHDAKEYGSIIHVTPCDWDLLRRFAVPRDEEGQLHLDIHGEIEASARLQRLINIGEALAQKYHTVVTNPLRIVTFTCCPDVEKLAA